MALLNPWLNYIDRSYIQIKNELLKRLSVSVPEITDHSQSNIMIIILDIFAGIAEMLNYYIDNAAREAFITTARKYESVVRLSRLYDYRIKAAIGAKVDLSISFLDGNGDPVIATPFTLPQGTIFTTDSNIEFIATENVTVPSGSSSTVIPCSQETLKTNQLIGITDSTLNQLFSLGTDYTHDSIDLKVAGVTWTLVDTLGKSSSTDKHYIIDISIDKIAYVIFGDNVNGAVPPTGQEVRADYSTTKATDGNVIVGTIKNTTFNFSPYGISSTVIENKADAVAGSGYEDIEKIRRSVPLSIRTLDRAVTKQDYIDIVKLAPGVDKANVDFNCGKTLDIYIVPNGGGIAPLSLLNTTQSYIDLRKMVTTFVTILPTGQSDIFLDMDIKARFRASLVQAEQDVRNALIDAYSYKNSDVNKPVRISDIIAIVDNLDKVDYLILNEIYISPYFRPTLTTTPELVKSFKINKGSVSILNWKAKFDSNNITLFKVESTNSNYTFVY